MVRVFVETKILEHEAERADGSVISVEMMVVKVHLLRVMAATHIDDRNTTIVEIFLSRLTTNDRCSVFCNQNANGEHFVFMSSTWVGEDEASLFSTKIHLTWVLQWALDSSLKRTRILLS